MAKTAIILGATGFIGGLLLNKLITDDRYKSIKLFSRNSVNNDSKKIKEYIINVLDLKNHKNDFIADEVYCCLGTTKAKTKDKSIYKTIDYGIPLMAASLSKENGIQRFLVISSMGADASSSVFYNKTKGEMERDVMKQQIKQTFVVRPSLIGGKRKEFRFGERVGKIGMTILKPLLVGRLKKYRMIAPEKIVTCLLFLANSKKNQSIFNSEEIENIYERRTTK
mgnify:CR=1 FL=1|tara:strand:- start:4661 stop:5332 length:672 start_codon:yes stop_codon:yes gene_type:complete